MSEDTRGRLLDAALAVIARKGLHGLTFRAVTAEADCALGLLNYHFTDKEALIVESYQRIVDRLMTATLAAVDAASSPDEKVIAYISAMFRPEFLNTDYLSLRLSLWAASASDTDIAALNSGLDRQYWEHLAALIEQARPSIGDDEARRRATDIMVAQNGIWLTWIVRPDGDAADRTLEFCRRTALES